MKKVALSALFPQNLDVISEGSRPWDRLGDSHDWAPNHALLGIEGHHNWLNLREGLSQLIFWWEVRGYAHRVHVLLSIQSYTHASI